MEMDSIIARLGEMASYCDTEIDAKACTEAAGILFALMDGGCKTRRTSSMTTTPWPSSTRRCTSGTGPPVTRYIRTECGTALTATARSIPTMPSAAPAAKSWMGGPRGKGASGMANRKQRRHNGKPQGVTYADVLARKRQLRDACQQAANDTMVQIQSDIHTQRAMWMMCVAMNDAFGIGPERFQKFAQCLQDRTEWYEALVASGDEDYANEKLRLEAQRCSGIQIEYLYEAEMLAAQKKHEQEGLL